MSAIRYSGSVRIQVTVTDDVERQYRYRCVLTRGSDRVRVYVGEPATLNVAVDSSEAIDSVAHAALSFVSEPNEDDVHGKGADIVQGAAWTLDGSGWHVARKVENAWPKA